MKNLLIPGILTLALSPLVANADITVKLPADAKLDSINIYHAPILKLANAKSKAERGIVEETVPVKGGAAVIKIDPAEGGSRYGISFSDSDFIDIYAAPGEEIVADVTSFSPFTFTLSGSPLIDGINEINALTKPVTDKMNSLSAAGQSAREELMALYNEYTQILNKYIDGNLSNPGAVYAVMNHSGEDYIAAFDRLAEQAKTSMLYPLAKKEYDRIKEMVELEKRQQAMASGDVTAPDFTLKDLEGKDVSLSQFKGKWVILDFWGSWCIWCIKGFPELKEAYAKYKDEIVIIGIDCNESEADWKAGVKKHELPWVNVYCPQGNPLVTEFGIQGFPTKAIIDPEGKIRNITTGHNPEFFTALSSLIGK